MKSLAWLACFLLVSSFLGCNPRPFSPPGGAFSVQMPGKPKEETRTVNTAKGPVTFHQFTYDAGEWMYLAAYVDYPNLDSAADLTLDRARDGALKASQSVLLLEEIIKLDGHPGREIKTEAPGGITMRVKFVLVGKRLYQFGVATPKNDSGSPKIRAFLDTFRLTAL